MHPENLTLAHIASRWPRLFHLTEAGGWEAIREHGLLSTTALLDRFGITGPDRDTLESMRRPRSVQISHAAYGRAWIHDNKPVNTAALRRTLVGMSEEDWYRELNRRVFFWLTENRLGRHLNAQLNRGRRHDILVLDTARLLDVHGEQVELAHLNSGAVYHAATQPRGAGTFRTVTDYPWQQRLRTAPREPIVELTVPYAVTGLRDASPSTRN